MNRSTPAPAGLRALFTGGTATGSTDGQLLERFRSRAGASDPAAEAAFEALVDRHAAMVWGVCRRGLLDRSDAEDAFQATFLVLVRKAGSVRVDDRGSAGRWLYGVARKVASRQRQAAARRPAVAVGPTPGDDPAIAAERREASLAVAAELDRLPWKYRRPIELCDYEGLTYEQAGLALGWPTATIKSRLARGRKSLKARLARRGLAPSATIVMAELARECRAGVSQAVLASTPRVATLAPGLIPAAVDRLAQGAIRTMIGNTLKPLALLMLGGLGSSTLALAWMAPDGPPAATPPARTEASTGSRADEPDARWKRRLADGTTLEIVGVSTMPSGPDSWWRPDGRPLKDPDFELAPEGPPGGSVVTSDQPEALAIVYRVADGPKDGEVSPIVDEAGGTGTGVVQDREGKPSPELKALRIYWPQRPARLTFRFRSSAGGWRNIQRWFKGSGAVGGGKGRNFAFSGETADKGGGTRLSIAHDVGSGESMRVVAVDAGGAEQASANSSGASAGDVRQLTVRFDLAPDQIREFRIQARPVEEIVMPPIAAAPAGSPDAR